MPKIESMRTLKLFWVGWTEDNYGNRRCICYSWTEDRVIRRVRRRLW